MLTGTGGSCSSKGVLKSESKQKKIKRGRDHYRDLAHANRNGYQIDLLLDSSARLNFYPVYAIYGFSENVERCRRFEGQNALFICSAQEIYDMLFAAGREKVRSSDILSLTVPLVCLFCCPSTADFDSHGPQQLFEHYFKVPQPRPAASNSDKPSDSDDEKNRGYEKAVPSLIQTLFEMKERNDNAEGIIREYQSKFEGSNGIMIVKDAEIT